MKLGLVRLLGMSIGDGCGVRVFRLGGTGTPLPHDTQAIITDTVQQLGMYAVFRNDICLKSVFVSHIGIYWITGVLPRTDTFHREIFGREKHTRTNLMSEQCENIG